MAKVTGPLFSISASGAIAKSLVHFPWKGRSVVRKWLKPSNPTTTLQGDIRQTLGGLGRACSAVHTASQYAVDARVVAGPGQTWVSAFVKYCVDTWLSNAAAFEAKRAESAAHALQAEFNAEAIALGLVDFDVTYRGAATFFYIRHMLYMLAAYGCDKYATNNDHFNRAPFTAALNTWNTGEVTELVNLLPAL